MSDVLSRRNAVKRADTTVVSSAGDYEELPLLSALMCGVGTKDGKGYETPPHSLTLFLEGSLVKYVIGAGDDEPKWFGTTSGLSHGLAGIEASLRQEQGEWKPPKNSGRTWRK